MTGTTRNKLTRPGLTRKGCVLEAAIQTGLFQNQQTGKFDELAFEQFWSAYLSELLNQTFDDTDYLIGVLNKEREQRRDNHRQNLYFAILFSLSFFLGIIAALHIFL